VSRLLLCLTVLLLASPALAGPGFDHTYADWDATLRKVVDAQGQVDYEGLAAVPAFGRFVEALAAVGPEDVAQWPREQQVAFWINAYNALTFQTILDAGIPPSIRDIKPEPWEAAKWPVAGRTVSLNWIEHTRLREQLKEPRVHFVLVCAAKSCPVLPNRAVLPTGLDAQLDRFARAFFQDARRNRVDLSTRTVHLSRILDWYGGDFAGLEGSPALGGLDGLNAKETAVVRYLARFLSEADRAVLGGGKISVVYNEYDWSLNRR
jgi:hypothetical protein